MKLLTELEYEADIAALNYMKATEVVFRLKKELLAKAGELDAAEARATMLDRQFVATKIAYLEAKTAEGRSFSGIYGHQLKQGAE